jgi:hypothetical protein
MLLVELFKQRRTSHSFKSYSTVYEKFTREKMLNFFKRSILISIAYLFVFFSSSLIILKLVGSPKLIPLFERIDMMSLK